MNIRSITGLLSLVDPSPTTALASLRDLVDAARQEFARVDFPVETARVATQPLSSLAPRDLSQFARDLQAACQANAVEFASLGALPGHTSTDAIAAILLDLATLAVKLNKLLTARLIPIAGLRVDDETNFESQYLTRARVMDPHARALRVFPSEEGPSDA